MRRFQRAVFQQQTEFVATQTGQRVAVANLAAQNRGDAAQQFIARGMAADIVDDLEFIQIQVGKGVVGLRRTRQLDDARNAGFEFAAVHQPGQRILVGLQRQCVGQQTVAAHVMQQQHGTEHAAIAGENRTNTAIHRELLVVWKAERRVIREELGACFHQHLVQGNVHGLAGFRVGKPDDIADKAPGGILVAHAGKSLGTCVGVDHVAARIGDDGCIARQLKHHACGFDQRRCCRRCEQRRDRCRADVPHEIFEAVHWSFCCQSISRPTWIGDCCKD